MWTWYLCRALAWLKMPFPLRDDEHPGDEATGPIRLKVGTGFAVVSVRGVDVYLDRLTGKIDGYGYASAEPR